MSLCVSLGFSVCLSRMKSLPRPGWHQVVVEGRTTNHCLSIDIHAIYSMFPVVFIPMNLFPNKYSRIQLFIFWFGLRWEFDNIALARNKKSNILTKFKICIKALRFCWLNSHFNKLSFVFSPYFPKTKHYNTINSMEAASGEIKTSQ